MEEVGGAAKVPLSFWVVAGLGVLWNGFACMAYWLTATHNPAASRHGTMVFRTQRTWPFLCRIRCSSGARV